jgi:hypothetical protein
VLVIKRDVLKLPIDGDSIVKLRDRCYVSVVHVNNEPCVFVGTCIYMPGGTSAF